MVESDRKHKVTELILTYVEHLRTPDFILNGG